MLLLLGGELGFPVISVVVGVLCHLDVWNVVDMALLAAAAFLAVVVHLAAVLPGGRRDDGERGIVRDGDKQNWGSERTASLEREDINVKITGQGSRGVSAARCIMNSTRREAPPPCAHPESGVTASRTAHLRKEKASQRSP